MQESTVCRQHLRSARRNARMEYSNAVGRFSRHVKLFHLCGFCRLCQKNQTHLTFVMD
jgi:hypothetical protein